jgi:CBS domain-containing protein
MEAYGQSRLEIKNTSNIMMNENIASIMTREVVTVRPDDSMKEVHKLIFERRFHHLPVTSDGKLVGIITTWDLLKSNLKEEECDNYKVQDWMTRKVATLGPHELVGAAAMIFLKHLFHALPIVDEEGHLLGIVSTHDILRYEYNREYPDDVFLRDTKWAE